MAEPMIHRGPDAEGAWTEGPVGFGHRRLKIIDLSASADQPLFNEDGRVGVTYNGEIYNYRELRAELEAAGHRFRSRSDTEVLVHAFEQWGTESFARLNGIFAFALWDGRGAAPALYLVRDRFGTKPLFYAEKEGRLAFASELKPLLGIPWIGKGIRPETLFHFLKFSHVPGVLSILEDVRQLPPGTWLRFDGSAAGSSRGRFWDPLSLAHAEKDEKACEEEWLERLDGTLRRVVERQLVSDVPLGCFLSGGIDSSLLVSTYASLGQAPLRTFTIGYAEAQYDESGVAREVAEAFGCQHRELRVGARDLIDVIPDVPEYFDQPFADPSLLPTLLLARFAREHVTVALSGDGGDELFFGYPQHRALLYLRRLGIVPAAARAGAFGLAGRLAAPFSARAAKLAEILQFKDESELLQYFVGTIGPMRLDRLAGLLATPPARAAPWFSPMTAELRGLPWEERVSQVFIRTFLVDTVLAKTDRAGMAFGLEARVPFLDDEIAELSARLPMRFKLRRGVSKYLLRRLLERKLPGSVSRRPKRGFGVPLREWFRGELRYLLDEYLSVPRLRREGVFEPAAVANLVRAHVSGAANHSHLLWSLVSFQLWKERYLG
jgi:asparagine synthase (glutamine-hydrolysing)